VERRAVLAVLSGGKPGRGGPGAGNGWCCRWTRRQATS
jgi:hypothetical protein